MSGKLVFKAVLTCVRAARHNEIIPIKSIQPFLLGRKEEEDRAGALNSATCGALEAISQEPLRPTHHTHMLATEGLGPCSTSYRSSDPRRYTHGKQDDACDKHPGRQLAAAQSFMKCLKPTRQNRTGQRVQPKTCCFFTSSRIVQYKVNQIIELHKQQPSKDYVNGASAW